MRQTPPKSVVDYKIMWRNPNTKWTSDGGLIVQVGDSAHSFLPTSANGATQAMEDGISLAACLKLVGKNNIALATRVHTQLRSVSTPGYTYEPWTIEELLNAAAEEREMVDAGDWS